MGLIFTERTNGKYVTLNEEVIKNETEHTIKLKVKEFCEVMAELGLTKEQIKEKLNEKE